MNEPTSPPGTLRDRTAERLEASGRYPGAVLVVAITGLFATTFPITILTLALPGMARDFGVDEASMAWVVTLPMIASALALPVLGKLGDLHGHRRVFVTGFALAVVFTALSATAVNAPQLIAWRTLTMTAGVATMPSSLALINTVHHGARRAKAMGWWSMVAAGAPVIGLTVGAPAIDAFGWQMLFLIQSVIMVVPVAAAWVVLRETPTRSARFDLLGAVTLGVGVGPLLLAVNQAPQWGMLSPRTLGCLAISAAGLVAFWGAERRASTPLVPPSFLRERRIVSVLVVALFTSAAYMGGFFLASLMMVGQFGYSLTSAVPILAIRPILFAGMSPVGGWVTSRAGSRVSTVAGCALLAAGLAGLALGSATQSVVTVVIAGFVLQGTGYGLLRPAVSTALADAVDEGDLGMAGAAERLLGQLGVVFGITIMATTYAGNTDLLPLSFAIGAVFAVVGAVSALGMAARHRPADSEDIEVPPIPMGVGE